jgi:hypothetical protein
MCRDHGSARLNRISIDFSRFSCSRSRGARGGFLTSRTGAGEQRLDLAELVPERLRRSSSPALAHRRGSLLWMTKGGKSMPHAIIRGANGRRHEVDFEGVSSASPSTTRTAASASSRQRDLITAVGHVAAIAAGEFIQASGQWINDRTHGVQFRAAFLHRSLL